MIRPMDYKNGNAGRFRKSEVKVPAYILLNFKSMLAARTHIVQRLARNSSTVAGAVKVVAFETNQPTSSVTLFVKAGSRFQSKAGVANALKNFAFKVRSCLLSQKHRYIETVKSTKNRSAIGTVRQSELYGGVLSSSLGREHLSLTAEFLPQDA